MLLIQSSELVNLLVDVNDRFGLPVGGNGLFWLPVAGNDLFGLPMFGYDLVVKEFVLSPSSCNVAGINTEGIKHVLGNASPVVANSCAIHAARSGIVLEDSDHSLVAPWNRKKLSMALVGESSDGVVINGHKAEDVFNASSKQGRLEWRPIPTIKDIVEDVVESCLGLMGC